jgi:hypothetical protein
MKRKRRFAGDSQQHQSSTIVALKKVKEFITVGKKALRGRRCLDAAHDAELALVTAGMAAGNRIWIRPARNRNMVTTAALNFHKQFVKACVIKRRK